MKGSDITLFEQEMTSMKLKSAGKIYYDLQYIVLFFSQHDHLRDHWNFLFLFVP